MRLRGRFFAGALKIIVLRKQNNHQCRSKPNYDVHVFKQYMITKSDLFEFTLTLTFPLFIVVHGKQHYFLVPNSIFVIQ